MVAIAVPIITSRLERARLRWEGGQRRFEEFRALLDSSLSNLHAVREAAFDALEQINHGATPEEVNKEADRVSEATKQVMEDRLRISLRVDERDSVRQTHGVAMNKCTGFEAGLRAFERKVAAHPPQTGTTGIDAAMGRFMDEARRSVGLATGELAGSRAGGRSGA